jgi:hypothetical protein
MASTTAGPTNLKQYQRLKADLARETARRASTHLKSRKTKPAKGTTEPGADPRLEALIGGTILTDEERTHILAEIAQHGRDGDRIRAVTALEDMQRSKSLRIGAPPPTDHTQTVIRLTRLIRAAGSAALNDSLAELGLRTVPIAPSEIAEMPEPGAMPEAIMVTGISRG